MFIGHLGCETEMPSRCGGGPYAWVSSLGNKPLLTPFPYQGNSNLLHFAHLFVPLASPKVLPFGKKPK